MAEPVRGPETGGRSLADILREAGIENPTRTGRRRRWDDMDDTGIRQRGADAAREDPAARENYGRRSSDLALDRPEVDRSSGMPRVRDERFRRLQPGDGRPPAERPRVDRGRPERPREERPRDDRARREPPRDQPRSPARDAARDAVRDTGRRAPVRAEAPSRGEAARVEAPPSTRSGDASTAAIPGMRPSRTPAVPGPAAAQANGPGAGTTSGQAAVLAREAPQRERRKEQRAPVPPRADTGPSTGRIPVVPPDERAEDLAGDLHAAPAEGAMAWLRFAGELVIAAAVGVGVYFAFTVLWEMQPHLAALASPLVVTGLVLGVGTWRQRTGRGQLGGWLLGVLVFAGTVLTILPAAALLSG